MMGFRGVARRGCALAFVSLAGCGSDGGAEPMDGSSESSGGVDSSESGEESGDACVADCQPGGTVLWETHVGGPGLDGALGFAFDADGRIGAVGYANLVPNDFDGGFTWNGLVALVDADGTVVFQDMPTQHTSGVGIASDGSVVVVGGNGLSGLSLRQYDPSGSIMWESADAQARAADGGAIAILPSGEIVVGGGTETAGLIARYGADGTERVFTELPVNIFVQDLLVVGEQVVATGLDYQSSFWAGRTDLEGTVQWSTMGYSNYWVSVAVADDGNVIVAGETPSGNTQLYIYDADGMQVATAPLPRADVLATDIVVLPDGDLLLAGWVLGATRCWYARMDTMTSFAWQSDVESEPMESECQAIALAPDGTVIVGGQHPGPNGGDDLWIRRVAP